MNNSGVKSNLNTDQLKDETSKMSKREQFYMMKSYKYLAKIEKLKQELDRKGIKYDHILKDIGL